MAGKKYINKNVFEATQERIEYIFNHFERIYISFSGGKDSGIMLNLMIKYMREHNIRRKIGVMVMDNEANYTASLRFMIDILDANEDLLDIYWCCLPISLPCVTSSFQIDWKCWDNEKRDYWMQAQPKRNWVVNWENHKAKGFEFYYENMGYAEFWDKFGEWYAGDKTTACLIGIRTDESLNRFRAIVNDKKDKFNGKIYTTRKVGDCWNVYPIYDWTTEDIWIANGKFGFAYNRLYDLFYLSGMSIHVMRVASPFMSEAKSSLNMYRIIEPSLWQKVCMRVNGANFVGNDGKQLNYSNFKLPANHTWKSFTKFLLSTLPEELEANYRKRFIQSLKYWNKTGRGLNDKTIQELRDNNIKHGINGNTCFGSKTKKRVTFSKVPDEVDVLSCHNSDVLSWKRFAITILKNDHTCKYLGLAPSHDSQQKINNILKKYENL